jgi:hypothetical protein
MVMKSDMPSPCLALLVADAEFLLSNCQARERG